MSRGPDTSGTATVDLAPPGITPIAPRGAEPTRLATTTPTTCAASHEPSTHRDSAPIAAQARWMTRAFTLCSPSGSARGTTDSRASQSTSLRTGHGGDGCSRAVVPGDGDQHRWRGEGELAE